MAETSSQVNRTREQSIRDEPRKETKVIRQEMEQTRARMDKNIDALEEKISPRKLWDEVKVMFKSSGGRTGVVSTIRDNPIPAALAAAGLTWLVAQGGKDYTKQKIRHKREMRRGEPSGPIVGTVPPAVIHLEHGPAPDEQIYPVETSAGYASAGGTEGEMGISERAGEKISEKKEQVKQKAQEVKGKISEKAGRTREKMSELKESGMQRAHELKDMTAEKISMARESVTRSYYERPIASGAIMMAAGLAVGLSIPRTRAEDETIGQASDRLKAKGGEMISKGEKVAEAAIGAGEQQAGAVEGQPKPAEEKISDVTSAAGEAAREEARRQEVTPPAGQETIVAEEEHEPVGTGP